MRRLRKKDQIALREQKIEFWGSYIRMNTAKMVYAKFSEFIGVTYFRRTFVHTSGRLHVSVTLFSGAPVKSSFVATNRLFKKIVHAVNNVSINKIPSKCIQRSSKWHLCD